MKRKTNLFYESGNDSKFITFSNYTESLTGNFLSTDTKIFPSRFLCIKINGLNKTTKPVFIKYLSEYYENKLAVLRDKYLNINKNLEHNIYPLNYLLEALLKIERIDDDGIVISAEPSRDNDVFSIEYVSDITEQDYNGTYTDTICIVNLNHVYTGDAHIPENTSAVNDKDIELGDDENTILYGWNNDVIVSSRYTPIFDDVAITLTADDDTGDDSEFIDTSEPSTDDTTDVDDVDDVDDDNQSDHVQHDLPGDVGDPTHHDTGHIIEERENNNGQTGNNDGSRIDDDSSDVDSSLDEQNDTIYHVNSYVDSIVLEHRTDVKQLQFNCIIPLFDVVDINCKTNSSPIEEIMTSPDTDKKMNLIDEYQNNLYTKNVPLGMWLNADEDEETFVTLKRADTKDFSPSWSLVISSQFKPFPYSDSMPDDFTTNSIANSFATFAEVLSRQNEILDAMKNMSYQFNYMHNRITNLEGQMKQLGTSYNIDGIHSELIDYERTMNDKFETFRQDINSYVANFKWRTIL